MNILNILRFIGEHRPEYALEEKDGMIKLPNEGGYRNSNGKKEGYWGKYHSNGQLWYKENYVNGEKDGEWETYYSDGKLSSKGTYANGKKVS